MIVLLFIKIFYIGKEYAYPIKHTFSHQLSCAMQRAPIILWWLVGKFAWVAIILALIVVLLMYQQAVLNAKVLLKEHFIILVVYATMAILIMEQLFVSCVIMFA